MSDGEVRVFIPSVHPVIAGLSRTGEFLLSSVGLARQSYEPDYLRTQEWVDRIKDALVRGRFELTGGLQAMPDERLMQLPSDVEVVLRLGSFDVLTSVAVAKDWIQTVCDRQKAGRFEFVEVVRILEPHYGGHGKNACADVLEAFNSGALTFWMGEMPVNPIGRELPLDYGEYTTPEEVNTWLRSIKATYVFPMENMGCGVRSQQQEQGREPQQRRHYLKNRTRVLDAEIEKAKASALDASKPSSVWAELIKMAEQQEGLLIGHSSDGLQYKGKKHQDTGAPDVLTLSALRNRMRRDRAR